VVSHYIYETFLYKYVSRTRCTIIVCTVGFLLGLPFLAEGGFYLFELVDDYATLISCFTVTFLEAYLVSKFIGVDVLKEIIANKTGKIVPEYVFFSLQYICTFFMGILIFFSLEKAV
jgi:SNF family Na+-dependent transporter